MSGGRVAVGTEQLWPEDPDDDVGLVINWFVPEGARVEAGEPICEIQVEKVDVDVPAPTTGTLVEIVHGEDAEFERGAVLAYIDPA